MTLPYIFDINGIKIYLYSDYNFKRKILDESEFTTKSIICILTSWYKSPEAIEIANNNTKYNIVILANSKEEEIYFNSILNCQVIFCNKNIFLDENNYNIRSKEKIYDLVMDSCFCEYKNSGIAVKVTNTAHIGYFKDFEKKIAPNFGIICNYDNNNIYKNLNPYDICDIHNQSYVGGIFSLEEGACLASTKYLLSGLPVVSTKSKGGRDFWYNIDNSIMCENTEEDCYRCVELAKQKILNGEFDRNLIRKNTIELMNKYRNVFIDFLIIKIQDIFDIQVDKTNVNINLSLY